MEKQVIIAIAQGCFDDTYIPLRLFCLERRQVHGENFSPFEFATSISVGFGPIW